MIITSVTIICDSLFLLGWLMIRDLIFSSTKIYQHLYKQWLRNHL